VLDSHSKSLPQRLRRGKSGIIHPRIPAATCGDDAASMRGFLIKQKPPENGGFKRKGTVLFFIAVFFQKAAVRGLVPILVGVM
jgi:hypothetical protein